MIATSVSGLDITAADQLTVLGLVAVAAVLGAALGAEREMANKAAGVRTHMLVATGAALVVGVGDLLIHVDDGTGDPSRTLHGVITGLGFLGAGAIVRHRDATVEGLTTAASLWFAGAVGAGAGLGVPILAAGVTVIGLVVLRVVGRVEARWIEADQGRRPTPGQEPADGAVVDEGPDDGGNPSV
ncbi:MgtC/SapB family protein [Actinomarinicola tropica]|nr:MgtC/SapB family protein [Actinomarinicola tropica]